VPARPLGRVPKEEQAAQRYLRLSHATVTPGGTEIPDRITPRLAIRPGVMAEALDTEESKAYREEMAQDIRNQQVIKRAGRPEEQAATIAFLASDDASFITGQVINCSGGQS
jgi:dihydroxycyclohexadiene carboxylate dehydrogenase